MAPAIPKLLVVDPLTLMGRELLLLIQREQPVASDVEFCHTSVEEEHQIAEHAGGPALVPPLAGEDELEDCGAVLVASDSASTRLDHLIAFMERNPGVPVVDAGRVSSLREHTVAMAGAAGPQPAAHARVGHPSLVALAAVVGALRDLEPVGGTVAAVEPASALGKWAVGALARQAGRRIQGAPVEETIDGHVLAFNEVATADDELNEEAAVLLPDFDVAVTRTITGLFHGHLAHIGLRFRRPMDEGELWDAVVASERLTDPELPIGLDRRTETDQVAITPPRLSRDRRQVAITAMVDGLRIGGALTALEILRSMA